MGVNVVVACELTRLTCGEVIGEADLQMTQKRKTCAKVDAQVSVLQTILTNFRVIHFIADRETKLRTSSQIDTRLIAKTDVVTGVDRDIQ